MVKTGLEVLLADRVGCLKGRRVGVIANPSSVDSQLNHIVDLFYEHPAINLTRIMGPQHGARGETQDNMIEWQDYEDPATGLPVHSLYGWTRKPTDAMLKDLDVIVFDIQDVGARYYTFIYTMALAMEACGERDLEFVVLDRPNPINGMDIEGPVLDPAFRSFVGLYPLPMRHGLTVGELARYFSGACGLHARLTVIPMQGWSRGMHFDDTGLPWVLPSPNMPTPDTAFVYPGMCLLEGTNVSEGRGSTRPFEISGAPWVDPRRLVDTAGAGLPGVKLRPLHFIPTFHKWSGVMIGGVQIHVTDRSAFRPVRTALNLVKAYRDQAPEEFAWKEPPYEYEYEKLPFDILAGSDRVREQLEGGATVEEIESSWEPGLTEFGQLREKYLIYDVH